MPLSRAALLLIGSIAAACSAEPTRVEPRGFGQSRELLTAAPTPATSPAPAVLPGPAEHPVAAAASAPRAAAEAIAASVPALDGRREEADLRHQLATAADPTDAALDLAALLLDAERPAEALHALDTALARQPSPLLRLARAGVLRDLGQRHLAVAALAGLVREFGAAALNPGVLFELAELQWLEGAGDDAAATLATLRQVHAGDAWCLEHHAEIDGLAAEIVHHDGPQRLRLRDLLGNLRGAPLATIRLATLERLLAIAEAEPELTGDLADRVLAIAAGDRSPAVRAAAVRRAAPAPAAALEFCQVALDDGDALVRRFAAARAAEVLGDAATPLLLARLEQEQDPAAFAALDGALASVCGLAPGLAADGTNTGPQRQAVVALWRRRCANRK